jgi:hypothetical protein
MSRARFIVVAALGALAVAGCAPKKDGRASSASGGTGGSGSNAAGVDTGRVGHTFVVTYDSGPIDRIRVVRDTSGRIVVEGAGGFPDGTRVVVTLMRALAGGRYEAASRTSASVELGRFMSSPLVDETGAPPPPGSTVRLHVSATFAPGQQTDAVLNASANGRRFRGLGMHEVPQGYAIWEQTIEAPL